MFHVEHPEPKKTTAKTRREAKEFEKIERGEAKSANAGPFSRKIIKNRVQKAALMCYTKLYKGPAEGKTAGFVLEMFHVEQIFFPEGSK